MIAITPGWWLLARVLLVAMFPFSALDKMIHRKAALKQANSSILPGGPLLLFGAMAVELIAPACILVDWHAQAAAWVLIAFCAVTAVLYHPFWKGPDFWAAGDSVARNHFWDFMKNFGLAGGLLLVALGAGIVRGGQ